jgi:hypothetical protein
MTKLILQCKIYYYPNRETIWRQIFVNEDLEYLNIPSVN